MTDQVGHDDPRYPTLVRGFNRRWVGTPRHVELCRDPDDVRPTVQRAVDAGLRITVRGGSWTHPSDDAAKLDWIRTF